MYILGISAYYHDSACILIKDGQVLFAVEEERFTRVKHDNSFPYKSIDFCLQSAGITIKDITAVAYYEKPLLKFERILETIVATYPFSLKPFVKGLPEWFDYKIKVAYTIKKKLKYRGNIYFVPHHLSHASSSFLPSSFDKAAILTVDGVGEQQTTGLWIGKGTEITPLMTISFPHSLGLLYSTFTAFLGFRVNEDEYKVMGLAAYGKPSLTDKIYRLIDVQEDGSFHLNLKYFAFREDFTMWNKQFEKLFGKPRGPRDKVTQRYKDIAASIQYVTENIYFKMMAHLYTLTKSDNICISGGVGLNALANGKIYKNTPFKQIYILGPSGDSGAALGAALYTYHSILENKKRYEIKNLSLGSDYTDDAIEAVLQDYPVTYKKIADRKKLIMQTASLLKKGNVIGWFQDRMEFGPRALGNRSILAKPSPRQMKERVNDIKLREQFRPFAGSILQEKVHEYFSVPQKNYYSPFMNYCFQVKAEKQKELAAITHQDGSCRIQTVNRNNGLYYDLIKEFYKQTGNACILNTSFNLKGEPIVETPKQALEDFLKTKLDVLVIGDFIVSRKE